MKIDFFADVMMSPPSEPSFYDKIEMLAQLSERGAVENIRAGLGAIEGQHADVIVSDLAPNH